MNLMERARPAPSRRREVEIRDWNRVQRLYAFCRCRAIERIIAAPDDSARPRRIPTSSVNGSSTSSRAAVERKDGFQRSAELTYPY